MTQAISTDVQTPIIATTTPINFNSLEAISFGWLATIEGKAKTTRKTYEKVLKIFFHWLKDNNVTSIDEFALTDFSNWAKTKSNATARLYTIITKKFCRYSCQKYRVEDFTVFVEGVKPDNEEIHKRASLDVEESKKVLNCAGDITALESLRAETLNVIQKSCNLNNVNGILLKAGDIVKRSNRHYLKIWIGNRSELILLTKEAREAVKIFYQTRLQTLRNRAMVNIMLKCGLRTVEVSRLDASDIIKRGKKYFLRVQGKGRTGKSDLVLLPPKTKAAIDEYLMYRADFKAKIDDTTGDTPMFISLCKRNFGGRIDVSVVAKAAKGALQLAGLTEAGYSAHSLRHAAACIALTAGKSVEQVRQLLRHKSLSVTTVYVRDIEFFENDAASQIELQLEP